MERFNTSIKGYNILEVNSFVDETIKNYSAILDKLKARDAEIFALKKELEKYKSINDFTNQVALSYENANQIKELARTEARSIIDDAKKNASRIVNDALLEAEKIEVRAENIRRNMIVFKRRMRSALKVQLETFEDIEEINLDDGNTSK